MPIPRQYSRNTKKSLKASITNKNQGGGNKKSGLINSTGGRPGLSLFRAGNTPSQRASRYCINQIGSTGGKVYQTRTPADGVSKSGCVTSEAEAQAADLEEKLIQFFALNPDAFVLPARRQTITALIQALIIVLTDKQIDDFVTGVHVPEQFADVIKVNPTFNNTAKALTPKQVSDGMKQLQAFVKSDGGSTKYKEDTIIHQVNNPSGEYELVECDDNDFCFPKNGGKSSLNDTNDKLEAAPGKSQVGSQYYEIGNSATPLSGTNLVNITASNNNTLDRLQYELISLCFDQPFILGIDPGAECGVFKQEGCSSAIEQGLPISRLDALYGLYNGLITILNSIIYEDMPSRFGKWTDASLIKDLKGSLVIGTIANTEEATSTKFSIGHLIVRNKNNDDGGVGKILDLDSSNDGYFKIEEFGIRNGANSILVNSDSKLNYRFNSQSLGKLVKQGVVTEEEVVLMPSLVGTDSSIDGIRPIYNALNRKALLGSTLPQFVGANLRKQSLFIEKAIRDVVTSGSKLNETASMILADENNSEYNLYTRMFANSLVNRANALNKIEATAQIAVNEKTDEVNLLEAKKEQYIEQFNSELKRARGIQYLINQQEEKINTLQTQAILENARIGKSILSINDNEKKMVQLTINFEANPIVDFQFDELKSLEGEFITFDVFRTNFLTTYKTNLIDSGDTANNVTFIYLTGDVIQAIENTLQVAEDNGKTKQESFDLILNNTGLANQVFNSLLADLNQKMEDVYNAVLDFKTQFVDKINHAVIVREHHISALTNLYKDLFKTIGYETSTYLLKELRVLVATYAGVINNHDIYEFLVTNADNSIETPFDSTSAAHIGGPKSHENNSHTLSQLGYSNILFLSSLIVNDGNNEFINDMVQISKDSCVALDDIFEKLREIYNDIVDNQDTPQNWQDKAQGDAESSDETDNVKRFIGLFLETASILFYNPNLAAENKVQTYNKYEDFKANNWIAIGNPDAYHPNNMIRAFNASVSSKADLIYRVVLKVIQGAYKKIDLDGMKGQTGAVYEEYIKAMNVVNRYFLDLKHELDEAIDAAPPFHTIRNTAQAKLNDLTNSLNVKRDQIKTTTDLLLNGIESQEYLHTLMMNTAQFELVEEGIRRDALAAIVAAQAAIVAAQGAVDAATLQVGVDQADFIAAEAAVVAAQAAVDAARVLYDPAQAAVVAAQAAVDGAQADINAATEMIANGDLVGGGIALGLAETAKLAADGVLLAAQTTLQPLLSSFNLLQTTLNQAQTALENAQTAKIAAEASLNAAQATLNEAQAELNTLQNNATAREEATAQKLLQHDTAYNQVVSNFEAFESALLDFFSVTDETDQTNLLQAIYNKTDYDGTPAEDLIDFGANLSFTISLDTLLVINVGPLNLRYGNTSNYGLQSAYELQDIYVQLNTLLTTLNTWAVSLASYYNDWQLVYAKNAGIYIGAIDQGDDTPDLFVAPVGAPEKEITILQTSHQPIYANYNQQVENYKNQVGGEINEPDLDKLNGNIRVRITGLNYNGRGIKQDNFYAPAFLISELEVTAGITAEADLNDGESYVDTENKVLIKTDLTLVETITYLRDNANKLISFSPDTMAEADTMLNELILASNLSNGKTTNITILDESLEYIMSSGLYAFTYDKSTGKMSMPNNLKLEYLNLDVLQLLRGENITKQQSDNIVENFLDIAHILRLQTELNFNSNFNDDPRSEFTDLNRFGMVIDGSKINNGFYGGNVSESMIPNFVAFGDFNDDVGFVGEKITLDEDGDKSGEGARFIGIPGNALRRFLNMETENRIQQLINMGTHTDYAGAASQALTERSGHSYDYDLDLCWWMGLYGGPFSTSNIGSVENWESNYPDSGNSYQIGSPFIYPGIEYMMRVVQDTNIVDRFTLFNRNNSNYNIKRRLEEINQGSFTGPICGYGEGLIRSYIQDWLFIGSFTNGEKPGGFDDVSDSKWEDVYSLLPSHRARFGRYGAFNPLPDAPTRGDSYFLQWVSSLYTYMNGRLDVQQSSLGPLSEARFKDASPTTADEIVFESFQLSLRTNELRDIWKMKNNVETSLRTFVDKTEGQGPATLKTLITLKDNSAAVIEHRPFHFSAPDPDDAVLACEFISLLLKTHFLEISEAINTRIEKQRIIKIDQVTASTSNSEANDLEFSLESTIRNIIINRMIAQKNIIQDLLSKPHYFVPTKHDGETGAGNVSFSSDDFIAFVLNTPSIVVSPSSKILREKLNKVSTNQISNNFYDGGNTRTLLGQPYLERAPGGSITLTDRSDYVDMPLFSDAAKDCLSDELNAIDLNEVSPQDVFVDDLKKFLTAVNDNDDTEKSRIYNQIKNIKGNAAFVDPDNNKNYSTNTTTLDEFKLSFTKAKIARIIMNTIDTADGFKQEKQVKYPFVSNLLSGLNKKYNNNSVETSITLDSIHPPMATSVLETLNVPLFNILDVSIFGQNAIDTANVVEPGGVIPQPSTRDGLEPYYKSLLESLVELFKTGKAYVSDPKNLISYLNSGIHIESAESIEKYKQFGKLVQKFQSYGQNYKVTNNDTGEEVYNNPNLKNLVDNKGFDVLLQDTKYQAQLRLDAINSSTDIMTGISFENLKSNYQQLFSIADTLMGRGIKNHGGIVNISCPQNGILDAANNVIASGSSSVLPRAVTSDENNSALENGVEIVTNLSKKGEIIDTNILIANISTGDEFDIDVKKTHNIDTISVTQVLSSNLR